MAMKGETFEIPSKQVNIKKFEILKNDNPILYCRVECSKGTYIRSLAHDLGKELKCSGIASHIHRTQIGKFNLSQAIDYDCLDTPPTLLSLKHCLSGMPYIQINNTDSHKITQGQKVLLNKNSLENTNPLQILNNDNELIGIGSLSNQILQPKKVFL